MAAAAEMQNLLLVPPDALISHSAKRQSRVYPRIAPRSTQTTADAALVTQGRAQKERNALKGLKASHFACKAHDRQTVKDAVKSLRRCGVRVVHAALLRVQVA